MSDRDRAVLTSLKLHRFLTTYQLQRFHFEGHDSLATASRLCRRTLARLAHHGLIEHLERRIGGIRAGSTGYIWRLGPAGDGLLRLQQTQRPRDRRKEPSLRFLDHRLAVAATHLRIRDAAVRAGGQLIRLDAEPASWRSYRSATGARDILKPDLYAVTVRGDWEDHWFIEVDRDTESLPTIVKKCQQYLTYRSTGTEQSSLGIFPKIVWVTPDSVRADRIALAIAQAQLPSEAFRAGTEDDLGRIIAGGAA